METKKLLARSALCALLVVLSACASKKQPKEIYMVKPATIPEGTTRLCWVAPRVSTERVRAGLNEDGTFYNAPHDSIREVKQGLLATK